MKSKTAKTGLTWQVILLAGPLVLQNLSQTLLGVVDTYFVSRLNTESLAAVGLASIIYFTAFMLYFATARSAVVFVGRAHGEGNDAQIGNAVWRCLNTIGWLSITVLLLPWLFKWVMYLGAPSDSTLVAELGTAYLQIRAIEIPLIMFSAVVWGFMVGRGDSRTPMILAWITVLVNILLDYMFVLGNFGAPQLGVAGAAYASVVAQLVNAVISAFILWRPENRKRFGTGRFFFARWQQVRSILTIGIPMGVGEFIEIASFGVFIALIGQLGTDILAANQIALQFMSISFTFGSAIGMAASSLVSQYLGAKQPDIAEKIGYRALVIGMIGMGLIGLSYLIAPESLLTLFSSEPTVIRAGVTVLRVVALYQVFDAVAIVLAGALNGAGDTRFTMVVKSCLAWGFFIPSAWVALNVFNGGIGGAWAAALIYLGVLGAAYVWRYRTGIWKTIEVS